MTNEELCARIAHDANRRWCEALGDHSQVPWEEAQQWQRDSVIEGVKNALAGATPREMHESWLRWKVSDGWTFGETKDPARKKHPCMVDYDALPPEQRVKDSLFIVVVKAVMSVQEVRYGGPATVSDPNELLKARLPVEVLSEKVDLPPCLGPIEGFPPVAPEEKNDGE